jgi:Fe-S cluster assembly protein SufD
MPLNLKNLPHRRQEAWKWTDVQAKVSEDQNGLTRAAIPDFDVPEGVFLSEGEGHKGHGAMAELAAQFGGQSWNIYVPADTHPASDLVIDRLAQGHARIAIMIDKGASLTMTEIYEGTENGFSNLDLQIHLAEGATLNRRVVHRDPDSHIRISNAHIAAEANTNITQHCLSFGGELSRLETGLTCEGAGVKAVLNGAYLLNDKRHTDMTSFIRLKQPDSHIRQAVKGVVTDKSRGVFQGKFLVERPAQHTDAAMRHDALMLSETSEVRAKPELEIYADDVACEHGNTIGALDESALFYMRQRGIPLKQARALLTEAFVSEAFDGLADEALRESLTLQIRDWLGAV